MIHAFTGAPMRLALSLLTAASLFACGQGEVAQDPSDLPSPANFEVNTNDVVTGEGDASGDSTERTPTEPTDAEGSADGDSGPPEQPEGDALMGEVENPSPEDSVGDAESPSPSDAQSVDGAGAEDGAAEGEADTADGAGPGPVVATSCEGLDNGAACEDGDLCTTGDTCLIGVCQPGEGTVCDGQGPCRVGTCDPLDGGCDYVNAEEGSSCEDGDACSALSTCQGGLCVQSEALVCPDQGPCKSVVCDVNEGCIESDLEDGTPCELPCYDAASCTSGACVGDPSAKPACAPASEPCVDAWLCDPESGGCTVMIPTDADTFCDTDGSQCTLEVCDGAGACVTYEEDACEFESSLDPCWNYTCEAEGGCAPTEWAPTAGCPGPPCGDGFCFEGESCFDCPFDCGECCGDGTCTPDHEETCATCAADCGECCGNGACDFGESCFDCPSDCGACCGDGECIASHLENCLGCPNDCGECCGNGLCDGDLGESCFGCPEDCGSCCGNGACDFGETCLTCASDCGECCTSGTCDASLGDNCQTCPEHCGECCGNGTCDAEYGEDCAVCEADCGACCGDGTCDPNVGETCGYCPEDCGSCCGNGVCDPGEDCASCEGDCGLCACGNGLCCAGETCESCEADCGPCAEAGSVLGACSDASAEGITRNCGWTYSGDQPCVPGETITIACHQESPCNLGSCQGDAMLRICDGGNTACTANEALAQNDNACGTACPYLTFVCPASGQLSVLTAPHKNGEEAQCIWSTYPDSPNATLPCSEDICGPERECGWVRRAVMPCSPGITLEVGCGAGVSCELGSSQGDPMIRVCAGDHVICDAGTALGASDDVPGCGFAPGSEFICPQAGVVTILSAPKCSNDPHYTCELCAACPSCTPPW